ncbi:hypothetical protein V2J09_022742 [Rumex salicifolius]
MDTNVGALFVSLREGGLDIRKTQFANLAMFRKLSWRFFGLKFSLLNIEETETFGHPIEVKKGVLHYWRGVAMD